MTLDDLLITYAKASNEACVTTDLNNPNFAAVTMKAGIAAVVRALWDDVCRWDENGHVRKRFKTILGSDAEGKAGAPQGDDTARTLDSEGSRHPPITYCPSCLNPIELRDSLKALEEK